MKYFLYALAAFFILTLFSVLLYSLTLVSNTTTGVLNRTFDAQNVIYNYEWFHDVNSKFVSKVAQIQTAKQSFDSAESNSELKARRSIELDAQRQVCRELANDYNANAIKTNRNIFRGKEAPESLDASLCEK